MVKNHNFQRNRKNIILIAFEGKNKTEFNYFKHFNNRDNKYNIVPLKSPETNPKGIADYALKYAKNNDIKNEYGDKIFCVIDLDLSQKQLNEYQELLSAKKYKEISCFVSNPCFEVWFLFHFLQHPQKQNSSENVKKYMREFVENYEENVDVYEIKKLKEKQDFAIKNAKDKAEYLKDIQMIDKNPYSEIYKILMIFDDMNK